MKQIKINKLECYVVKAIFFISILCVNTAWASRIYMVCEPTDEQKAEYMMQSTQRQREQVKDYKITIKIPRDIYEENADPSELSYKKVDSSFPLIKFFAGGSTVTGFRIKTEDGRRVVSVKGGNGYFDGTTQQRLRYTWLLSKHGVNRFKGNAPLGRDEYMLEVTGWEGINDEAIAWLAKQNNNPSVHDFHFIPGIHICQFYDGKKLLEDKVMGPEQPKDGDLAGSGSSKGDFEEKMPKYEDLAVSGRSKGDLEEKKPADEPDPFTVAGGTYSEFECFINHPAARYNFSFKWGLKVSSDKFNYRVLSDLPLENPELNTKFVTDGLTQWYVSKIRFRYDSKTQIPGTILSEGGIIALTPSKEYRYAVSTGRLNKAKNIMEYFDGGYCEEMKDNLPSQSFKHIYDFRVNVNGNAGQ